MPGKTVKCQVKQLKWLTTASVPAWPEDKDALPGKATMTLSGTVAPAQYRNIASEMIVAGLGTTARAAYTENRPACPKRPLPTGPRKRAEKQSLGVCESGLSVDELELDDIQNPRNTGKNNDPTYLAEQFKTEMV